MMDTSRRHDPESHSNLEPLARPPRWVRALAIIAGVLLAIFIAAHLGRGGFAGHEHAREPAQPGAQPR
jgi:hypothetical protein